MINLEKELLKQNKKIVNSAELLVLREYETYTELANNDSLSRLGLNRCIVHGKGVKERIDKEAKQAAKFGNERVFHISQIESLCKKYHLRFLHTGYYKGTIDKQLPYKITNFEAAFNVKCNQVNTKIAAPKESFELEERPKDPLLFYQINEQYYYLIHKWGNDLSPIRLLYPILASPTFLWLVSWILPLLFMFTGNYGIMITSAVISLLAFVGIGIWQLLSIGFDENFLRFIKPNDWDSTYK